MRWAVTVVSEGGAQTINEARDAKKSALAEEAKAAPLVGAILAAFPNATLSPLKTPEEIESSVTQDALAEVEDEWDPFEDE